MRLDPYIVNTLMRGGWPDKPCFYRVLEPWVGERAGKRLRLAPSNRSTYIESELHVRPVVHPPVNVEA